MHATLEEAFGAVISGTTMELFPPVGWGDIATKADLEGLAAELRGEMALLRGEMAELRGELRGEMAELRGELRGEMAELRGETALLRGELRGLLPRLYVANLAGMIGVAGLVLAAARLG